MAARRCLAPALWLRFAIRHAGKTTETPAGIGDFAFFDLGSFGKNDLSFSAFPRPPKPAAVAPPRPTAVVAAVPVGSSPDRVVAPAPSRSAKFYRASPPPAAPPPPAATALPRVPFAYNRLLPIPTSAPHDQYGSALVFSSPPGAPWHRFLSAAANIAGAIFPNPPPAGSVCHEKGF